MNIKLKDKAEAIAEIRMNLISTLIGQELDHRMLIDRKKEIAERNSVSYRTLGRYLDAFKKDGFEGLKPKPPQITKKSHPISNFTELVNEAIILRRECPTRSVSDIIKILEMEGRVGVGTLKRTTLQHHLQNEGFSKRQVMIYQKTGKASRRFQKDHRCELWQSDIKYGPYLPIGEKGSMKQVYLCSFIDDATRFIVSAGFYENQDVQMIEDCLRQAIMRFGKPVSVYVDNGRQYRSKWLNRACAKLGIRLLHTKVYDPEAKGKSEAFNRRIGAFLSEVALKRPDSLDSLNQNLEDWINGYYHKNEHRGLGGISPYVAFTMDSRMLDFVGTEILRDAFLHSEERIVDKTGCISFKGKIYEVGMKLAGFTVDIVYDPACIDQIEIHHKDFEPFSINRLEIGPFCGYSENIDPNKKPIKAETSRMLDALHMTNDSGPSIATSFRKVKGDPDYV